MRTLMIPLALVALCQAAQARDVSSAYTDIDQVSEGGWSTALSQAASPKNSRLVGGCGASR